jgi:hypothetical protein
MKVAIQPSMRARDWQSIANGRVVLTDNKGGGFGFWWPSSPQDIKYLFTPWTRMITENSLKAEFSVTAEAGVSFISTDGDGSGHAHLIIMRQDWQQGGADDRWWSNPATVELANGTFTLQASLQASDWTNVYGQSDPKQFDVAMSSPAYVGLTFGGVSEFGHGVGVHGGNAKFNLSSFQFA